MNMLPATSTTIRAVGYNSTTRTMRVEFLDGGTYDYYRVEATLYEQMLLPNPWRRLQRVVKLHDCRRVK